MGDASVATPSVLHRDARWICIDKPEGWHSVDARESDGSPTVQSWLRERETSCAPLEESGLVHRLDQWTGGCLIAATDADARASLRAAFGGGGPHALRKWYTALALAGLREEGEWTMHFASRYARSAKVTASREGDLRTRGTCRWKVIGTARAHMGSSRERHGELDVLEVELVGPGRRHQIRAGFAALGHPLAGDSLYGGVAIDGRGVDRPALHATRLEVDGTAITAPLPAWAR
ncbi:MAG: RNA pseudouridine synthase [Phycisphaerales bacterium]|nr:RNA pseudouridine synthase [Phycisphaerales bacterium]